MKNVLLALLLCCCFTPAHGISLAVKVLSHDGKPLPDLVVYLTSHQAQTQLVITPAVEINQRNKSFAPYITVVQQATEVNFHNQDDITHHIYSPLGENRFDLKLKAGEQATPKQFTGLGDVVMGCNIHDWMSGHLLVVATPYFGKTDLQGMHHFTVAQAGDYQLTVWHPQMKEHNQHISQMIELSAAQQLTIQLSVPMDPLPKQTSDDDFGFLSDY